MSYREAVKGFRRAILYQALVENYFDLSATARALGVHRNHVSTLLKGLNLDVKQARANFHSATILEEARLPTVERRRLENVRTSITRKFKIEGVRGYIIVGLYEDGTPGELFLKVDQVGSTARGFADAWALQFSLGLQYGIPLALMLEKARATRFAPHGFTGDKELPTVTSILDYVARWLQLRFINHVPAPARRVVAHCASCNQDFYSMEESSQHDRDNLIKHRRERNA